MEIDHPYEILQFPGSASHGVQKMKDTRSVFSAAKFFCLASKGARTPNTKFYLGRFQAINSTDTRRVISLFLIYGPSIPYLCRQFGVLKPLLTRAPGETRKISLIEEAHDSTIKGKEGGGRGWVPWNRPAPPT
jgi:hypothetical protein